MQVISEDILKELLSVEGRYIEWEWDTRTLTNDYITMREPDGLQVAIRNNGGRSRNLKVPLRALEELIQEQLVSEDPSRKVTGFRLYRINAEGRKRGSREYLTGFAAIKQIAVLLPIQSFNLAPLLDGRQQKGRSSVQAPIQINFEGVLRSDVIEGCIRQEWENLNDIGAPIKSSIIVVTQPRAKHFSGDPAGSGFILRLKAAPISTSITIQAREDATTPCR